MGNAGSIADSRKGQSHNLDSLSTVLFYLSRNQVLTERKYRLRAIKSLLADPSKHEAFLRCDGLSVLDAEFCRTDADVQVVRIISRCFQELCKGREATRDFICHHSLARLVEMVGFCDATVQRNACASLAVLASDPQRCKQLARAGAIVRLSEVMTTHVPEVQVECCRALAELSMVEDLREDIVEEGCLIPLVGLSLSNGMYGLVRVYAIQCLEFLVREEWIRARLLAANAVAQLESISLSNDVMIDVRVRDMIARVLTYFSTGSMKTDAVTGNEATVHAAGKGIRTLFLMLEHHDDNVRAEGVWAIANFAKEDVNRVELIRSGGLVILRRQLEMSSHLALVFQTSRAFAELSKVSDMQLRCQFSSSEILPWLRRLLKAGVLSSPECRALKEANASTVTDGTLSDIIQKSMSAANQGENVEDRLTLADVLEGSLFCIQQCATEALISLSEISVLGTELCKEGFVDILILILQTDVNYDTQLLASNVLRGLSANCAASFKSALWSVEGLQTIVDLLQRSPEVGVRIALLGVLYELCFHFAEVRSQLGTMNAFSVLSSLLSVNNMDVILAVLRLLAIAMLSPVNLYRLHEENVLHFVINFAFSVRDDIRTEAIKIIRVLSVKEQLLDELMELGVMRPLLSQCRNQRDPQLLSLCLETLCSIIHDSTLHFFDVDRIVTFHSEGSLPVLLEALRSEGTSSESAMQVLLLLGDLARYDKCRREMLEMTVLPHVLTQLQTANVSLQSAAAYFLSFYLIEEDAAREFLSHSSIAVLAGMLNSRHRGLERYCFDAFSALAHHSFTHEVISQLQFLPVVLERLTAENDDPNFQLSCARCLKNFARGPMVRDFEQGGLIRRMHKIVSNSLMSKDFYRTSVQSVGHKVSSKTAKRRSLIRKVVAGLLNQTKVANAELQRELVQALDGCCAASAVCQRQLLSCGGLDTLLPLYNAEDRELRILVFSLITCLVETKECWEAIVQHNLLAAIHKMLQLAEEVYRSSVIRAVIAEQLMLELLCGIKFPSKRFQPHLVSEIQDKIIVLQSDKLSKLGFVRLRRDVSSILRLSQDHSVVVSEFEKSVEESVEERVNRQMMTRRYARLWLKCRFLKEHLHSARAVLHPQYLQPSFLCANPQSLCLALAQHEEWHKSKTGQNESALLVSKALLLYIKISQITGRRQQLTSILSPRYLNSLVHSSNELISSTAAQLFLLLAHMPEFASELYMKTLLELCGRPTTALLGVACLNDVASVAEFRAVLSTSPLFRVMIREQVSAFYQNCRDVSAFTVGLLKVLATVSVDTSLLAFLANELQVFNFIVDVLSLTFAEDSLEADHSAWEHVGTKDDMLTSTFSSLEEQALFESLRCLMVLVISEDHRHAVASIPSVLSVFVKLTCHRDVRIRRLAVRSCAEISLSSALQHLLVHEGCVPRLARSVASRRHRDIASDAVRCLGLLASDGEVCRIIAGENIVTFLINASIAVPEKRMLGNLDLSLEDLSRSVRLHSLRLLALIGSEISVRRQFVQCSAVGPLFFLTEETDSEIRFNATRTLHHFAADLDFHPLLRDFDIEKAVVRLLRDQNIEIARISMLMAVQLLRTEQFMHGLLDNGLLPVLAFLTSMKLYDFRAGTLKILSKLSHVMPSRVLSDCAMRELLSNLLSAFASDHLDYLCDILPDLFNCYMFLLPSDNDGWLRFDRSWTILLHEMHVSLVAYNSPALRSLLVAFLHAFFCRLPVSSAIQSFQESVNEFNEGAFEMIVCLTTLSGMDQVLEHQILEILDVCLAYPSGVSAVRSHGEFFEVMMTKALRDMQRSAVRRSLSRCFACFCLSTWSRSRLLRASLVAFCTSCLQEDDPVTDYYVAHSLTSVIAEHVCGQPSDLLTQAAADIFRSGCVFRFLTFLKTVHASSFHSPITYEICRFFAFFSYLKDYRHALIHEETIDLMLAIEKICGRDDVSICCRCCIFNLVSAEQLNSAAQSARPPSHVEVQALLSRLNQFHSGSNEDHRARYEAAMKLFSWAFLGSSSCNTLLHADCVPYFVRKVAGGNVELSSASLLSLSEFCVNLNCAVAVDKEGVGPIFFLARKHFPEERRLAASRVIITLLFHVPQAVTFLRSKSSTFSFFHSTPLSSQALLKEIAELEAAHVDRCLDMAETL